jgi:hypothetical protein
LFESLPETTLKTTKITIIAATAAPAKGRIFIKQRYETLVK